MNKKNPKEIDGEGFPYQISPSDVFMNEVFVEQRKRLNIVVSDDEIKIKKMDLGEDVSAFRYLSLGSDVLIKIEPSMSHGGKFFEVSIKPDLSVTSIEKVLLGVGMLLGKRPINVDLRGSKAK